MKTKKETLIVLFFILAGSLFAQNQLSHSPFQVAFVYPVGTHGTQSVNHSYDFSLNILTGNTGSINGFELAGLLNMNRSDVSGFQLAGLGNITRGDVDGVQIGGLFNLSDSLEGVRISGIYGQSSKSEGLQVAGIINISSSAENSIAGLVNINRTEQKGLQIAGIYNQTNELNGVQIGLINISDTISNGISIGLINLIRKGYYDEFTISAADYLHLGFSYKLGLKKFYTIYTIGMNYLEDQLWVVGLGLGHLKETNPRFAIQPEFMWYTYFPMDFQRKFRETYVSHFKLGLVRRLGKTTAVSVAPGIYMAWKSNRDLYDTYGYDQSLIGPVFDVQRAANENRLEFGFGLSVAVHLGME